MKHLKTKPPRSLIALAVLFSIAMHGCDSSSMDVEEPTTSGENATTELPEAVALTEQRVSAGDSEALLSWDPIAGAAEYTVYFSTDANLDRATAEKLNDSVGTITGTSAAVIDLDNESTYYFWVEAADGPSAGAEVDLGSATPNASVFGVAASHVSPQVNALEVNPNTPLIIPFNFVLDASSVDENAVTVTVNEQVVDVSLTLIESGLSIEVLPDSGSWAQGATHQVSINTSIQTQAGASLGEGFDFLFTTLDSSHLVAWWDFDDSLLDTSGHNNDIDTNQGVTFNNETNNIKSGTHSAYFDGTSYLKLSADTFELGDQFAVATWIKIPTIETNINTILSNAGRLDRTSGFKIGVNGWQTLDKDIILEAGDGLVGGKVKTGPNIVQDGQWYHFAFNVDKLNLLPNGQHAQIFFNGAEAEVIYKPEIDGNTSDDVNWEDMRTNGPLYFGSFPDLPENTEDLLHLHQGFLDDFRIYNRNLTSQEVINIAR